MVRQSLQLHTILNFNQLSFCLRSIKFVFVVFVLATCQERFYPPVGDFSDFLIVEGTITNQAEPQEIKLSRTFGLDTTILEPEQGATVHIISAEQMTLLQEMEPGIYKTNPSAFVGEIGATYKLSIVTMDGIEYLSDSVVLKYVPPIDSIHWQWEEKLTIEEGETLEGVQLYVSAHDPSDQTSYYRWDWEETYEFVTEYESTSKWDSKRNMAVPRLPEEQIYRCWNTVKSSDIVVNSSAHLSRDIVSGFPFYFVSNRTRRLQIKYRILVKQYALSEEGYRYWHDLKTMAENTKSIFGVQPFQVKGNVHNTANSGKDAIGYFDACAVQEKRIVINRHELENKPLDLRKSCEKYGYDGPRDYSWVLLSKGEHVVLDHLSPTKILWTIRYCADCTVEGVTKKPEFWP